MYVKSIHSMMYLLSDFFFFFFCPLFSTDDSADRHGRMHANQSCYPSILHASGEFPLSHSEGYVPGDCCRWFLMQLCRLLPGRDLRATPPPPRPSTPSHAVDIDGPSENDLEDCMKLTGGGEVGKRGGGKLGSS
jgi:hypothetical protein